MYVYTVYRHCIYNYTGLAVNKHSMQVIHVQCTCTVHVCVCTHMVFVCALQVRVIDHFKLLTVSGTPSMVCRRGGGGGGEGGGGRGGVGGGGKVRGEGRGEHPAAELSTSHNL